MAKAKAKADITLPSVDKLIKDGQPEFGVFAHVNTINYLDYHSHLLSQKPVATWRKHIKANQFSFIQIVHPPYRICFAVGTIKLASSAFIYIYNEDTDNFEVLEAVNPLGYRSRFEGDHNKGEIEFHHNNLSIQMHFVDDAVDIAVSSAKFDVLATLTRVNQPLAVCTPSGRRGWTFTQKEPFARVWGKLTIKTLSAVEEGIKPTDGSKIDSSKITYSETVDFNVDFNDSTLANMDWTLGFMRYITNWFWACIHSQLPDGRVFMLNLSMGVNETGVSENACWLDGQIVYLPPVMFRRPEQNAGDNASDTNSNIKDASKAWQINHQNLGWSTATIDLTFTPLTVYQKTDNYGVVASLFEQWIGLYSGTIILANNNASGGVNDDVTEAKHHIELNNVLGLAEDHVAKW